MEGKKKLKAEVPSGWGGRAYEVDGLVADVLEGDGRHGCLLVDDDVVAASAS